MIAPQEAWRRLEPHLPSLPRQSVRRRSALGRVLAEALTATVDVPGTDVSAMDGYAVAGPISPGERRRVVATIAAGDPPGFELPEGAAALIMTGASVPRGADRVIPVEQTDGGHRTVILQEAGEAGAHIRRRGEVVETGDPLLAAGTVLTPGALGLLATHGYGSVQVHGLPGAAVLVTGDEVIPPEAEPRPGQLRDSNSVFLRAAGSGLGLRFWALGVAPDRQEPLTELVRRGLEADVLLISGGVSKGLFDLVEGVLRDLGCEVLFDAVAIQPAKPLVAAHHPGGLVFGLPGNPASVMVGFWLFVRPVLRRLMGLEDGFWQGALDGELAAPLPPAKGRDRFLPAEVRFQKGQILVTPLIPKGSHDVDAYARGTALVRIPAHSEAAPTGRPCQILPLPNWPQARPRA
jgi:molybdopterin molybdotransferase